MAAQVGLTIVLAVGLMADVPIPTRLFPKPAAPSPAQIPPGETIPVLPDLSPSQSSGQQSQGSTDKSAAPAKKAERLQEYSRLEIIRYVMGEFAKARRPLPGGKDGFTFSPGKPVDDQAHRKAVAKGGAAASAGDQVQITQITFKGHEIVVDINGGGRGRKRFRDRVQISVGGFPTVQTKTVGGPEGFQVQGSTLILDFGKPLPDMSPDDVKKFLDPFLDFSKQRSATVNWVDTLPPEIQKAIKERKAVVGMDRDMVIAAMGRPEKKIRERDDEGLELEDWIYGNPPGKTIFVTFSGEKVIRVKEFPR